MSNSTQYVLYYLLPNRRLAVVREFKGIVLSYANEENAIVCARHITANEVYHLDYPIVVKVGFGFDNTCDGVDLNEADTMFDEVYGYPIGKQPRGLYPITQLGV